MIDNFVYPFIYTANDKLLQWLLITFCNNVLLSTFFIIVNNVVDDCSGVTIRNNIINNYQQ